MNIGLSHSINRGQRSLPTFSETLAAWDGTAKPFDLVHDFVFGSGAVAGPGQTAITNLTELETWFNPHSDAAPNFTINEEHQKYTSFNSTNHALAADALELTATKDATLPLGITTQNPASDVTASRTIPLASTVGLQIGQVVGFGPKSLENLHVTQSMRLTSASGTWANGGIATIKFTDYRGIFQPVTIQVTAGAADSNDAFAQKMVDAINANATLAAQDIRAFWMHRGAYAITYPRASPLLQTLFGSNARGSMRWLNLTLTTTEGNHSATHTLTGPFFITAIAAGASIEINCPVTLLSSDTVTFSPCYVKWLTAAASGSTYPLNDAGGLEVGQVVQMAFQDSTPRQINSISSNNVVLNTSSGINPGGFLVFLPMFRVTTTAASSSSTTLTIGGGVPAGVQVGHVYLRRSASYGAADTVGIIKVTAKTATTITLDTAVTIPNSSVIMFIPPVLSGQIWLDSAIRSLSPSTAGTDMMGVSITAEWPDAADIGSFPAPWMFGTTGFEYDFTDTYGHFNNQQNNDFNPQGGVPTTTVTTLSVVRNGNNLGPGVREISAVIEKKRAGFYLDNMVRLIRTVTVGNGWDVTSGQFGIDLAVGSFTGLWQNGLAALDYSQFPMKIRVQRIRIWRKQT